MRSSLSSARRCPYGMGLVQWGLSSPGLRLLRQLQDELLPCRVSVLSQRRRVRRVLSLTPWRAAIVRADGIGHRHLRSCQATIHSIRCTIFLLTRQPENAPIADVVVFAVTDPGKGFHGRAHEALGPMPCSRLKSHVKGCQENPSSSQRRRLICRIKEDRHCDAVAFDFSENVVNPKH